LDEIEENEHAFISLDKVNNVITNVLKPIAQKIDIDKKFAKELENKILDLE